MKLSLKKVEKSLADHLKDCYGIPKALRERYTQVLLARAVRFYIENHLDDPTIEEDLYEEDGEYPNLDYSEEYELKAIKERK